MELAEARKEYDLAVKILSNMVYSRPIALASLSQKTGIKLVELMRCCARLEKEKLIRKSLENGNTYYILMVEDYEDRLGEPPEDELDEEQRKEMLARQNASARTSRDAILKRRSMRARGEDPAEKKEPERPVKKEPARISAMDLVAISRSSANQRIKRNSKQAESGIQPVIPGQHDPKKSGGFRKLGMSSSAYKSVYVNRPTPRGPQAMRSSFMMQGGVTDPFNFERSDGVFKQKEYIEPPSLGPIVPCKVAGAPTAELKEAEVREKLGFSPEDRMITLLTPKPCHELWAACSALANAGGGTVILGIKKFGLGDNANFFVKAISKPEESIKTLIRAFNDRTYISDCPRDPEFIKVVYFGHKKLLAVTIDPAQLSPAPLYTSRNSFCARETDGCYLYKNGEVVHCTEEEVKQLWEMRRFGAHTPDWEQNSEQIPVMMERKKELNILKGFNDELRPESQKECKYGEPDYYQFVFGKHRPYPGKLPPEREPVDLALKIAAAQERLSRLQQDAAVEIATGMDGAIGTEASAGEDKHSCLQGLLFAEDICVNDSDGCEEGAQQAAADVVRKTSEKLTAVPSREKELQASEARPARKPRTSRPKMTEQAAVLKETESAEKQRALQQESQKETEAPMNMPPLIADFDRAKLEEIALPAIEHSRLPTIRLCEIAVTILQTVRLRPTDLATLLNRKIAPVRDKILPKIKETHEIQVVDGFYFILK